LYALKYFVGNLDFLLAMTVIVGGPQNLFYPHIESATIRVGSVDKTFKAGASKLLSMYDFKQGNF